jgi:TolB protein
VRLVSLAVTALVACGGTQPAPMAVDTAAPMTFAGEPALFARGIVSSEYSEVRLAMSPRGERVLWGSRDRPGRGGKDVWMSRRTADGWTAPEAAPFNSDADDYDPAFSPDGAHVYFFSTRPGGAGGADLYRVPVTGDGFGAALHLGPEVNTAGDEWAPTPSPDGTQLLFASNTPGAKHDLYVARITGAGFEKARRLPGALNDPDADELDPTFLADGTSIVYSRARHPDPAGPALPVDAGQRWLPARSPAATDRRHPRRRHLRAGGERRGAADALLLEPPARWRRRSRRLPHRVRAPLIAPGYDGRHDEPHAGHRRLHRLRRLGRLLRAARPHPDRR